MVGRFRRTTGAAIVVAALSAGSAMAGVPQFLTEQGQLVDPTGNPIAGNISITFALYSAASGGTPQSAAVNTAFARALQVVVRDAGNNPPVARKNFPHAQAGHCLFRWNAAQGHG